MGVLALIFKICGASDITLDLQDRQKAYAVQCEKDSHASVTAYVQAVANITVNNTAYCEGNDYVNGQLSMVWVTQQMNQVCGIWLQQLL